MKIILLDAVLKTQHYFFSQEVEMVKTCHPRPPPCPAAQAFPHLFSCKGTESLEGVGLDQSPTHASCGSRIKHCDSGAELVAGQTDVSVGHPHHLSLRFPFISLLNALRGEGPFLMGILWHRGQWPGVLMGLGTLKDRGHQGQA